MSGAPGLQAERTALAWQRTGISGCVVAVAALTTAISLDADPTTTVGIAILAVLCGAACAVAVEQGHQPSASPWLRLLATAAIPVLLSIAGLLLAIGMR